jgi:hypothetical protein
VNWATVVPTLVTGVVGVAGIVGSIVSATIARKAAAANVAAGIQAEDRRANLSYKRRLYADCLSLLTLVAIADASKAGGAQLDELTSATSKAWEIRLIAAPEVYHSVLDALGQLTKSPENPETKDEFQRLFMALPDLMRRDLEQHAPSAEK